MGKKGKKGKQKKDQGYIVDGVDTTTLTLKQLQIFCDKVYQEIVRTELESRSLELERNKLKTMVELSNQALITAKRNRRCKEMELGLTHEAITFDAMEQQKDLKNVRNEKNQEVLACMTVVDNNLQSLQRDCDESRVNIEQDLRELKTTIVQQDKDRNSKVIVLKQKLEQEKSNLLSTKDNDSKLQTARYEKQMAETAVKLKNKFKKEMEDFNEYKIKKINEFLRNNDKLNVSLQHYYEKLLQRNMNVLNGMHENYKLVKDDVRQIQSTLKVHREIAGIGNHEIENNNEKIIELSNQLASSKKDQKKLKDTKKNLIAKQKKLKHQQWDNLFLEEALRMMKKEHRIASEKEEKKISRLKNTVMSEMLIYECWVKKIMSYLVNIDSIIGSQAKVKSGNSSISLITEIAFAQLEEEAREEEKQRVRFKFSSHTSHTQENHSNSLPNKSHQ